MKRKKKINALPRRILEIRDFFKAENISQLIASRTILYFGGPL
jgi:hypothetical protein